MSSVYEDIADEFNELRTQVKELKAKVSEMYSYEEYESNAKQQYEDGYQDAMNVCEDFFESRMKNLVDHIQKLNLTSTQLG